MPTARAPSASALKISVPRRKPPSTRTGKSAPTASTTSGRMSIVPRPVSVERNDDAVGAALAGEHCVFCGVDPLEQEFQFRHLTEAIEVAPIGGGRVHFAGQPCEHGFDAIARGALVELGARGVAGIAIARVGAGEARDGFGVAPAEDVDGPGEHFAAGGLDAADELLGVGPRGGHVELIPGRFAEPFGDLLDAGRGHRREHLYDLFRLGRARRRELAIGMEGALRAHRAVVDRGVPAPAEELEAETGIGRADEASGADLVVLHGLAIRPDGEVVIDAGRHVAPVGGRKGLVGERFEVEDAEGVLERRLLRECGERAGGQEAEELPAGGALRAHGSGLYQRLADRDGPR
jgi:hypothetical protein